MTTAGWVFCAFCGVSFLLSAAAMIAMIFYVYAEKREERERIAARMPHPAPKPDAAKECGVVPPRFDEQPRRMGRYKVFVSFWWRSDAAKFHDLTEFYRYAHVRKCDFSPSTKMDEDVRLCHIANRIAEFYRLRRMSVRTVKIYRRRRWFDWTFPEVKP